MENYKLPLLGLFTAEQLRTMRPSSQHTCRFCGGSCGAVFELVGCKCQPHLQVGGCCLDDLFDGTDADDYLFCCPRCDSKITDYQISKE